MDPYVLIHLDIDQILIAPGVLLLDVECATKIFNQTNRENSCISRESQIFNCASLMFYVSYNSFISTLYIASTAYKARVYSNALVHVTPNTKFC